MLCRDSIWYLILVQQWWAEHHHLECRRPDNNLRLREGHPEESTQQQKVLKTFILFIQSLTSASNRYGVDLIHFTQNKGHAVHASTKENDIIRSEENTLFPNGDNKTEDWNEGSLCSGTCPWRKTSTYATLADMTRELSPWLWIPLMRLFCLAGCYLMRCDNINEEDSDYFNYLFPV